MRPTSRLAALGVLALSACTIEPQPGEALRRQGQAVKKGAVVVTEIFASPLGSGDGREWIEVHNTTTEAIDLEGWTFQDDKKKAKIDASVVVAAGGYAVLGQSDKSSENGGVVVAFAYGKDIGLSGSGDEVHLLDPDDKEIDAVVFKDKSPWPTPVDGAALQLDPAHLDKDANDDGASWCLASVAFAQDGSLGTPGKANPSCGGGGAGSGGSGGSGQSGAAGTTGAGAGGKATGGQGPGGSGTAGSGAVACQVRFSKVDVNQPDADGAPKDTGEAVELEVTGDLVPGSTTLADCGVDSFSPYDADADAATGACGPKAKFYAEVKVGAVVVPASGRVVIGTIAEADLPLGGTSAVLKNGPDVLTLRASDGSVVAAVAYPDNDAPEVLPTCSGVPDATSIPADDNAGDSNRIDVLCPDGWRLVDAALVTWKAPNPCETGAAGSGGSGQSGAAGKTSAAGAAGKGGAGDAGKASGGSGGDEPGGSGGPTGNAGGSSAGGTAGPGGAGETTSPSQDGDCSCHAAGTTSAGGAGTVVAALAMGLAGLRRRGRRG